MQNVQKHDLGAAVRRWCSAAALAVLLSLPAQAVQITPETPMDQLRQIPCLRDRGITFTPAGMKATRWPEHNGRISH